MPSRKVGVDRRRVYYPEGSPDEDLYVNDDRGDAGKRRVSRRGHRGEDVTAPRICGRRCVATTKTTKKRCKRPTCQDYRYCPTHLASEKHLYIGPSERLHEVGAEGLGLYAFDPDLGRMEKDPNGFPVRKKHVVFKKDEEIGDYGGEKMSKREFDDRYDDPKNRETSSYSIGAARGGWVLDGLAAASAVTYSNESLNVGKLMRRSKTPAAFKKAYEAAAEKDRRANALMRQRNKMVRMKAARPIRQGEEILWHYGAPYWNTLGMKKLLTGKGWGRA